MLALDHHTRSTDPEQAARARALTERAARRPVVCARCGAHLTDASQRIEVAGQHQHTFFNPAGVIYQVACFAAVPGCSGVGAFSPEFSWFAEHRWQVAICASCREHLGWHFQGASTFSALIVERIQQLDA